MTLNLSGIQTELVNHAAASGLFDSVMTHEPAGVPGTGVHVAIWLLRIDPIRASGLAATTARVTWNVQCRTSMDQEPSDDIDTMLYGAVEYLLEAYTGDFTLGGTVRNVDLLGAHALALAATGAYVLQEGRLDRVVNITLPVIVEDAWTQAP